MWKRKRKLLNLPKRVVVVGSLDYTFKDEGQWSVTEAWAIKHAGATTFSLKGPERTNEGDGADLCMASFSGSLCDNTQLLWSRNSGRTQAPSLQSRGLILPVSLSLYIKCSACTSNRGETDLDSLDTLETFTAFMLRISELGNALSVPPPRRSKTGAIGYDKHCCPKCWNHFLSLIPI